MNIQKAILTAEEILLHLYGSLFKSVTSVWKYTYSLPPKEIPQIKNSGKVMMIIFIDHKGVSYQYVVHSKLL